MQEHRTSYSEFVSSTNLTPIHRQSAVLPLPLTPNERNLLDLLNKFDEKRLQQQSPNPLRLQLTDLASGMGVSRSTAQRAVRGLVGKQYVQKSPWKGSRAQDRGCYFHLAGVVSPGVVKNIVDQAYDYKNQVSTDLKISYTRECGEQASQSTLGCVSPVEEVLVGRASSDVLPSNLFPKQARKPRVASCAFPHPGCPVHPHALTPAQREARTPTAKAKRLNKVEQDNADYLAWMALHGNTPTAELIAKGVPQPPKYNRKLTVVHGNYRRAGLWDLQTQTVHGRVIYLKEAPAWYRRNKTPAKMAAYIAWKDQVWEAERKAALNLRGQAAIAVLRDVTDNFETHWATLFEAPKPKQGVYIRTATMPVDLDKTSCVSTPNRAMDRTAMASPETPDMTDPSDRKLRIETLISKTAENGAAKRTEQLQRRAQRRLFADPEPVVPSQVKPVEKAPNKRLQHKKIKTLWTELWKESFKGLPCPAWDKGSDAITYQLVSLYPDVADIERMVKYVLLNWDGVRKQLKLTGTAPTSIGIVRKLHAVLLVESVAWYAEFEKNMQKQQSKDAAREALLAQAKNMAGK